MSYEGVLKARGMMLGTNRNCVVSDDGVATFPIGGPTFTSTQAFPELGNTSYSATSGLGITTSTTPSEAISKIDSWLNTYLLDAPPLITAVGETSAVEYVSVTWTNPPQKKLAFHSGYVPQISAIKADIVPTGQAWSNAFTITLESPSGLPTVTSLKLVLDYTSGTSNLTGGVYSHYGTSAGTRITGETQYSIRVYAENDATLNGGKSKNYTYFNTVATLPPGPPNEPTNLSVTSGGYATWTIPSDLDINSDATPNISQYKVNLTATGSVRYPTYLTDHTTPQSTAVASGGQNAATNLTVTVNPGTTYSATVQGKNTLNANFGAASTPATFTSSLPSAPSWASSTITLAQPSTTSGTTLAGSAVSPIVNYTTISGGTPPRTSQLSTRLNAGVGTTAANIGTIEAIIGLSGSESTSSVVTVGFGNAFTSPQNVDTGSSRLRVVSEGDSGSGATAGFYKTASVYGEGLLPATNFVSTSTPYTMKLVFTPVGGSVVNTNTLSFYVDNMNSSPSVVASGITSASSTTSYVCGVPTYTSSTTFNFQTTLSNLAYRFLRTDKRHFVAQIETSGSSNVSTAVTVTKDSMLSPHFYYDAPAQAYGTSASLHNTSGTELSVGAGNIQFNTFSIALSGATQLYDTALQLRVTPYNIIATGTAAVASGQLDTSTGTTKPIRIDTKSIYALSNMSGTLMAPGSGSYPTSGYTTVYDHTVSLLDNEALQMVNGQWVTYGPNSSGPGYKSYAGLYFPGSLNQPDYSTITSGTRYVCIKFTNLKGSGTYDSATVTFTSTNLTLTPSTDSANFSLHCKIIGTTTSPWVSLTKAISASGWDAINTDGQGVLDNSTSSIGNIKFYVPSGTPANATIYLRFGLTMNDSSVHYLSNINCTAN